LKDLAETFLYDHTEAAVYISTLQDILLTYNPSLSGSSTKPGEKSYKLLN